MPMWDGPGRHHLPVWRVTITLMTRWSHCQCEENESFRQPSDRCEPAIVPRRHHNLHEEVTSGARSRSTLTRNETLVSRRDLDGAYMDTVEEGF